MSRSPNHLNRRHFLEGTLGAAAFTTAVYAAGSDEIKIGLIGCGARGRGAALQCLTADSGTRITALGDAFSDMLADSRAAMEKANPAKSKVSDDHCWVGLDAYRRVIDSGVDVVVLAAPSGFRPVHLRYAIEAGKHAYAEKSGAVDSTGIRELLRIDEIAKQKRLSVVAGFQRRYQSSYRETIDRVQNGAIGRITSGECVWLSNPVGDPKPRNSSWSDVEHQLRNWYYYRWLSGDTINEQLIHCLDVMNWVMSSPPLKATGSADRRVYKSAAHGNIRDHFVVTYTYPDNVTVQAEGGVAINGEVKRVTETVQGTTGNSQLSAGKITIPNLRDWSAKTTNENQYQIACDVLLRSVRSGIPQNDLKLLAEGTLTAIMGRMAADTRDEISREQVLNSTENLMPTNLRFGPMAVAAIPTPKPKRITPAAGNGDKYALLVAVRNYDKNELQNLKYSEPDVSGLSATLLRLGYRPENVVLMTQTRGAEDDRFLPRADNIRRELSLLLKGVTEQDSVIIGFAGHGIQYRNEEEAYFCAAGAKLADKTTLVSLGEIYSQLEKCPAQFKLLISDACRNDPRTSHARSVNDVAIASVTRPQKRVPPGGVAALFSCSAGEQAFEHDDLKHGVFYHFVIKGLEGEADSDKDGIVSLPELENYVKKRVFNYVRSEYGREQMPDFVGRVKGLVPLVQLQQ